MSIDASLSSQSPQRPVYFVQSLSQHNVKKMSYGLSPFASPHHYHYSPIHHSRESSTCRFFASLKNPTGWKRLQQRHHDGDYDDKDEKGSSGGDGDDEGSSGDYAMRF